VASLPKWQRLTGDEVCFWGPRVFLILGPDPANGSHSITSRVAYWAGEIDAMEQAEPPPLITIRSLNELSAAITKAACTQAMHKQEPNDIPISATIDYTTLKPLLREALAVLKPYLIAKQGEIKRAQNTRKDEVIMIPTISCLPGQN